MNDLLAVLYVGDSKKDSVLIARAFKEAGYDLALTRVRNGEKLRTALKKQPWDLVIAENDRPRFGGCAALDLLQEMGLEIPLIAMYGEDDEGVAVSLVRAGAQDALRKGDLARLVAVAARTLDRRAQESSDTGRAQIEGELRESERRFREMLENINLIAVMLDVDGHVIFCNDHLLRLTGRGRSEVLGQDWFTMFTAPEQEIEKLFKATIAQGAIPAHYENDILTASGERRSVSWNNTILRDAKGRVIGTTSIGEDVTERRLAERKLQQSEAQYRSLTENSPDLIARFDRQFRHLYVNRKAANAGRVFTRPEEYVGRTIAETGVPELEAKKWEARIESVYATGRMLEVEDAFETPDGPRYFNTKFVPEIAPDGSILSVQSIARDITESKRAEEIVRESEERYRDLVENSQDLICTHDLEGRLLTINQTAARALGYATEEIVQRNLLDLLAPGSQAGFVSYLTAIRTNGVAGGLLKMQTRAGEMRIWEYNNNLRRVEDGQPVVRGMARDITERWRAERALAHSEKRFRALFEESPIPTWERDYSRVKEYLDALAAQGIADLRDYLEAHAEALVECAGLIRVLDVNKAAIRLYRADTKEELMEHARLITSRGELERLPEDLVTIAAGGTSRGWEGEDETLTGGRIEVRVSWSVAPGHEHDFSRVIVTTMDVTEHNLAQRAAAESFKLFSSAFEDAPIGMALISTSGRFIRVNESLCRILGYAQEGLLSRTFQEITHPDDLAADLEYMENLLSGKIQTCHFEKRYFHSSGRVIWASLSVSAIRDARHAPSYFIVQVMDVTERRQAEEKLRASEERFTQLVDHIQEVFWMSEVENGRMVYLSPAVEKIWDMPAEQLLKRPEMFIEPVIPEDREAVAQALARQRRGETTELEYRLRRSDGSIRWVWDRAFPIRDGSGRVRALAGVAADITERKQAEIAIRRHLSEFEALFETGLAFGRLLEPRQIGDQLIRTFARYLSWHHVVIRLLHPESGRLEVIAFNQQGLREEDRAGIERQFESGVSSVGEGLSGLAVKSGETIRTGNVHAHPQYVQMHEGIRSGLYMPLKSGDRVTGCISVESEQADAFSEEDERLLATLASQAAVAFENARLYQAAQKELIERGRIESALRASEAHYRDLADSITDILFELDQTMQLTHWNKAAEALTGVPASEAIGRSMQDVFRASGLPQQAEAAIQAVLLSRTADIFETVFKVNNEQRDFEVSAYPSMQGVSIVAKDVTERKQMETALAEERNQLAIRIRDRTADLSRANASLARALRVKDEFLANMSHELRTPLNAILGLSESLEEQIAGPLNEKQAKYLATISESGHHLLSLINDILDLAKIESGQITLDIGKVDLHSVCQASLRMIRQLSQKKRQDVSLQIEDGIGLVWADERRLKQMIVNLLGNAVKFTPEEGRLGLEILRGREEGMILITVWDHGIGISENNLSRLFRPFVQVDSGLDRGTAGTGLGLALVAQMARLHGGRVEVESRPGEGSRFTLVLPLMSAPPAGESATLRDTGRLQQQQTGAGEKRTVLVVEDSEEMIMMIRDYLENAGFRVVVARDGQEGVEQAKLASPHLVLMDIMMPRMDGLEAARRLRADPQFNTTPIIGMTALAMANDRRRCLEAGMDDYISKPLNLKSLAKMLRTILYNRAEAGAA